MGGDCYLSEATELCKNDWITDPFSGEDLPQLPTHVAEQFIDMTAEATNRISFASFKNKYPKYSGNIHFWTSMQVVSMQLSNFVPLTTYTKCIPQFQNL